MKTLLVRGKENYFIKAEVQERLAHLTRDMGSLVSWTYEIIRTNQGIFIGAVGNSGGGWLHTKITEEEAQKLLESDWDEFDKIYDEIVWRTELGSNPLLVSPIENLKK